MTTPKARPGPAARIIESEESESEESESEESESEESESEESESEEDENANDLHLQVNIFLIFVPDPRTLSKGRTSRQAWRARAPRAPDEGRGRKGEMRGGELSGSRLRDCHAGRPATPSPPDPSGPLRLMPNEGFRNGRSAGQTAGLIPGARAKMRRTDGSKASSGMLS